MHMYVSEHVGVYVYMLRTSNLNVHTDFRPPFPPLENNSEVTQPDHRRAVQQHV